MVPRTHVTGYATSSHGTDIGALTGNNKCSTARRWAELSAETCNTETEPLATREMSTIPLSVPEARRPTILDLIDGELAFDDRQAFSLGRIGSRWRLRIVVEASTICIT